MIVYKVYHCGRRVMKDHTSIKRDYLAASVVIGVILMVALTSSIAASIYSYVNDDLFTPLDQEIGTMSFMYSSDSSLTVTTSDAIDWSDIEVRIDGNPIDHEKTGIIHAGDTIILRNLIPKGVDASSAEVITLSYNSTNQLIATFKIKNKDLICNPEQMGEIDNNPPNQPINPYPNNKATNVDVKEDISWEGEDPDDGQTVTYDVYFDIKNPPQKVISNQSKLTYNPGKLAFKTTYYWKIISWDTHSASTEGNIWQFTTKAKKQIGGILE
jgi:FlaG/FlaF family flagellin (archaellin)